MVAGSPRNLSVATGVLAGVGLAILLLEFSFEALIEYDGEGNVDVTPLGAAGLALGVGLIAVGGWGGRHAPNAWVAQVTALLLVLVAAAFPTSEVWHFRADREGPHLWTLLGAPALAALMAVGSARGRRQAGVVAIAALLAATVYTGVVPWFVRDLGMALWLWLPLAAPFLPLVGDAVWAFAGTLRGG